MPVDGTITIPEDVKADNASGEIRMGTNAAFPPFEYTQGTNVVGFDVAMSQLIAKDCGRNLKVVDMSFDGLIAALQSDAIDFIAAGMTATDERRQNVDFSDPYYSSKQVIIVRK
jgi:polar amino acid transport system substrate-binding protein